MADVLSLQPEFVFPQDRDAAYPPLFLSPNPHLGDFNGQGKLVKHIQTPCSEAISAGKNTYVYDAHTYHTKVPPQGIERLIEYYTSPGDVVLDPFCGSGMTGVAATQTGRKALLSDLSPAAAFIAYNLNTPIDASRYLNAVQRVLAASAELEHFLYDTHCRACGNLATSLYTVWSYGMTCSHCRQEFLLWDVARDERPRVRDSKIKAEFDCPHCGRHLHKRRLQKTRRYPVSIGYKCCQGGLREAASPLDDFDVTALQRIKERGVPSSLWYPTASFPEGINTRQPIAAGIDTVDKAYTTRALWAMAHLWDLAARWPDEDVRSKLLFTLTSLYQRVTVFSEFRFWGGSGNIANYNVPALMNEQNVFRAFARKASTISWYFKSVATAPRAVQVSTQPASHLPQIPDQSVDYVFTDPPFGSNINYSEMNFLWESWLGVYTDTTQEAIVNKVQHKGVPEYQELLTEAFCEIRRVLKERGWLTVVFHNSSEKVWASLQNALQDAGFSIEGTQIFDKEHGTFKQFVSENAVGYDLMLHCRKGSAGHVAAARHRSETLRQAKAFIHRALQQHRSAYTVHYQHVRRTDEFDYRKLYAQWLAEALPAVLVSLSFEEFRRLIDESLGDEAMQDAMRREMAGGALAGE